MRRLAPKGILSPRADEAGQMMRGVPVLGGFRDLETVIADLANRGVHSLGDRQPNRLVRTRLDLAGAPRTLDGLTAQRVEEHGLADPAETGDDHAPLRAACRHPLERHVELAQLPVAAGQLRWPLPGATRSRPGLGGTVPASA